MSVSPQIITAAPKTIFSYCCFFLSFDSIHVVDRCYQLHIISNYTYEDIMERHHIYVKYKAATNPSLLLQNVLNIRKHTLNM